MADTIEPDTKDWTWVLHERCPECGFEAGALDVRALPGLVEEWAGRWQAALARPGADVRPQPDVWSPTEYGCHVRDVLEVFGERLALMLDQDAPTFANWDQDAAALEDRYDEQEPASVAQELAERATTMARQWSEVGDDEWERRGLRSNGSEFTVRTLGQYFAHDVVHHLWDVDA